MLRRFGPGREPLTHVVAFAIVVAFSIYVGGLAYAYYFHRWGIARHHLESGWMWLIAAALAYSLWSRPERPPRVSVARGLHPSTVFGFLAAAVVLYQPAVRLGFLSDDFVLSHLAAENQFFGKSWGFLRPLPLLGFKLAGTHPLALHAANILLHGVNAALVASLATIAGLPTATAVAAGALFLTFPGHPEAVAWCAGLQDVLMTTGVLTAVTLVNGSREALAGPALVAALLSKETAVVAPVLVWLSNRRRWRVAAVGLVVVAIYAAWRLVAVPPSAGYASAPSSYKLKELLVRPFAALTVPVKTSALNAWPWLGTALVCAFLLLIVRAAWVWRGDRARIWTGSALALWVLVSVAPVYSMFDVSPTLEGARYLYLPAAAWSVLIAALLMPDRSRLNLVLVGMALAASVAGLRANLMPWTTAAGMRDDLLATVDRARQAGCTTVWIRNVPDSVRGAYIFRNGLAEAVAPTVVTSSAPPQCWVTAPYSGFNARGSTLSAPPNQP
jgi:hypothetical protein